MFPSACLVMAQIQFPLIKKIKIRRPEHSLIPNPTKSDILIFALPPLPPLQSGRHMCIAPNELPDSFKGTFNRYVTLLEGREFYYELLRINNGRGVA